MIPLNKIWVFGMIVSITGVAESLYGQHVSIPLLEAVELQFLEDMTQDVLNESRILPHQFVSETFGSNLSGGTLIRPGGKNAYPSFWIRDYAMSLETGMVTVEEQLHMLTLTATTQSDRTWITKAGGLVPFGAIADHIRIDTSEPIYYPGTYSFEAQGTPEWGVTPPYCDQYFFIHMAYHYVLSTGNSEILTRRFNGIPLIDRLRVAFAVPPALAGTELVHTTEQIRGVDFGFRDAVTLTGSLSFPSILKYRAALELADLFSLLKSTDADQYLAIAAALKKDIPRIFQHSSGLLLASTGKSSQPDVWATALAIYFGILAGEDLRNACAGLLYGYESGYLSYKGNIRHLLTIHDHNDSTAWEVSMVPKNNYQNGAYWGTPTGWVCFALNHIDSSAAKKLAKEYISHLIEADFRKGGGNGAPYECLNKEGYTQNPIYLTSVSVPLIAFKKMRLLADDK